MAPDEIRGNKELSVATTIVVECRLDREDWNGAIPAPAVFFRYE